MLTYFFKVSLFGGLAISFSLLLISNIIIKYIIDIIELIIVASITKKNDIALEDNQCNAPLKQLKIINILEKISYILLILQNFLFSFMSILAFVCGMSLSYYAFKLVITLVLVSTNVDINIIKYLALTMTLVGAAYFPSNIGFWVFDCFNKISDKLFKLKHNQHSIAEDKKIILFLRPRLWVYFISILITIFNSFEKVSSSTIISLQIWLQLKPIAIESVFSLIVIDRFLSQFKNEKKSILNELKNIKKMVNL